MEKENKSREIVENFCCWAIIVIGRMLLIPLGIMIIWNRLAYDFNAPTYNYGIFLLAYFLYRCGAYKIKSLAQVVKDT